MSFHWHLNSHLPIRWCTSQPQHFIASASNRHVNVYRPFISNRISMFRPGLLVSYAIHILSLFTWDAQWNIICGLLLWMSQFGMISNSPKNVHPIMDGLLLWIQHYGEHTHTCVYIYICMYMYIYIYILFNCIYSRIMAQGHRIKITPPKFSHARWFSPSIDFQDCRGHDPIEALNPLGLRDFFPFFFLYYWPFWGVPSGNLT